MCAAARFRCAFVSSFHGKMEIVLHVPLPPLPLFRSPSRLECSSVSGSGSGPGLLLAHAGPTQTNRIFGHGSTRLCCLNKFGALIMLYTSSSSAGSHPAPPPLTACSAVSSSTWVSKRRVALVGRNALTGPWREIAYRAIMLYGK